MAGTDIGEIQISDLSSEVADYSVSSKTTDAASEQKETTYISENWNQYLGYYKKIPEYKTAINAFATWVLGKGYKTDAHTQPILDSITGAGEDTFLSILWNMLVIKKVNGDAFAEIIRNDKGTLINLKPLDPSSIRIVANRDGRIIRYEQVSKNRQKPDKKFSPSQIFHIMNDRIADEIHGTSITEAVEWVILARNEVMEDQRIVMHRNVVPVRFMEVDTDNKTKMNEIKSQYAEAIKKKEIILIPMGNAKMIESNPVLQDPLPWIKYLENFFYQALGVPKVILGGSSEFTEASSKIGYLTFEVIYTREVNELLADLWNQLGIRIEINKPASLENELLMSEKKNTGQTGFQANDTTAGVGE